MAPTRLARQTLFGFVTGRSQIEKGRRRNLIPHTKTVLKALPELDLRIWGHPAQDETTWSSLCTQWSRDAPENKVAKQTSNMWKMFCPPRDAFDNDTRRDTREFYMYCRWLRACVQNEECSDEASRERSWNHSATSFHCHHQGCKCGPFQTNGHLQAHFRRKHQAV